jgi:hypothetical protein
MKKLSFPAAILTLVTAALMTGCGDKSSPPTQTTNAASGGTLTAPVEYLGAMARAEQSAVKTIDTASMKSAIQMFQADQGRLPKDLNELVEKKFIPKIPATPFGTKLEYDASTGDIKIVKE